MSHESQRLTIEPLTSANWDALADLFGEGGEPGYCWCSFWRLRGAGGQREQAEENRALLRELTVCEGASVGHPVPPTTRGVEPGLVALHEGRAVGWVSVGPRADYPRLVYSTVLAPLDDQPVWSIVCFVVSKAERRRGIATQLLDAAIAYAHERGATTLEAYPADDREGQKVGGAPSGTFSMFERAGFTLALARKANARTRPRLIARRSLH